MAMSDCVKCWDTPCTCGYDYRKMSKEQRIALSSVILGVTEEEMVVAMGRTVPKEHPKFAEK